MSVIREPGRFSRHTRRRLVGMTAAASAAALEATAVGCWFALVVLGPRTASTALAGLGLLFCGALLRTVVFGKTTTSIRDLLTPYRIGASLALVAAWPLWLLVAERGTGLWSLALAGVVLVAILILQFRLERAAFHVPMTRRCRMISVLAASLVAVGATIMLASVWYTDWSVVSEPLAVGSQSVVVHIEAFQIGLIVFGLFAFLAHQRRFQQILEP